jgi:uncharacterized surface protein with fasciclin (FAS1) repeats
VRERFYKTGKGRDELDKLLERSPRRQVAGSNPVTPIIAQVTGYSYFPSTTDRRGDSPRSHKRMKSIGLILLGILVGATPISVAQDAAPPSVDLYSGREQTPAPSEPAMPDVPGLSQLDEAFKPRSLGKEADERRLHVEWRRLKNQVANDTSLHAAKAAAQAARTDLQKRQRLRDYYNLYYTRMSALTSSVEMKLALEALRNKYLSLIDQPRVRPSPSPATAQEASKVARLNSANQPNVRSSTAAFPEAPANVDIIAAAKRTGLNMFVMAMNFTRKAATLKDSGPVTVFAPTDDAFKTAPPGTIDFSLNPEKLGKLLDYHIVKGAVTSNELTTRKAPTLNGASLDIKVVNGEITVNDAHVVKADVKTPVGVIYVIDKVLVPPAE